MSAKKNTLLIGAHTSAAGGAYNALLEGQRIGATTIQLFTANQKQWMSKPLSKEMIDAWHKTKVETGLTKIMSHDSYLINLGSPKEEVLEKSQAAFLRELDRCHALDIDYLNFHPGAALKESVEQCLNKIVKSLLAFEEATLRGKTRLLLEATAGQGSTVGYCFEHLGYIIERVKDRIPIGVCIDTCHIFAAGYDVRTNEAWNDTLEEFDQKVGLDYLFAFHLNDSLKGLSSRVDRHAPLGKGEIGLDCFRFLVRDKRVRHLPMYLETPGGPGLWTEEIAMLKEIAS